MKNRNYEMVTALLSWLAGYLGADRLFRGEVVCGILKLITLGGFGIWWLVDSLYYTYKFGETLRS